MITWTKDQVRQVQSFEVRMTLDPDIFRGMSADDVAHQLRTLMAPRLVDMGHTIGVEIHPDDCAIHLFEPTSETPWERQVSCRWHPRTDAVELRGGQEDGKVYALRKMGDPLQVPVVQQTPWLTDETTAESALVSNVLTYAPTGEWSEESRRWVYALA